MAAQKKRYRVIAIKTREDDYGYHDEHEEFLGYTAAVSEKQAVVFVSRRTGVWPSSKRGLDWSVTTTLKAMEV